MRMTLLQMTQNILSAMDSDEVNSIFDTVESQQVAEVIKETYFDLFGDLVVPEHKGILKLEGLGDLDRPNYLRLPTSLMAVDWVKYKNSTTERFTRLVYMNPSDFLDRILEWDSTSPDVQLITDASGVEFYVKNNKHPEYYTTFDNEYLVFDSYDSSVEATMQATKTFAWGQTEQTWTASDSFIPSLDAQHFPFFLSEAKSVCFINIKQTANQKEEQRSRRHRIAFQYKKFRDRKNRKDEFESKVDYARHR